MKVIQVPITDVLPWDKNPRGIKTKDFDRLKKQITKLGEYKPMVAFKKNGKYVVIGGNMRLRAYQELGLKEVSISIVDAPSNARQIEFALSDNDRAGYYEEDALAELVYPEIANLDLGEFKVDLGEPLDLKTVVERYGPDIDDGADNVADVDNTPAVTRIGDLFTLGRHRLLCGDSTKAEDVARLMRGEKADMVFTDPPYGIDVVTGNQIGGGGAFGGKKNYKKTIGGDNWVKANRYSPIINDNSTTTARKHYELCREVGVPSFILWGGNYFADFLPPSRGWIAWDKVDGLEGTTKNFSDIELAWTSYTGTDEAAIRATREAA